jgi:peptidoglycan/LPS O-acetylase OafA/YrhL
MSAVHAGLWLGICALCVLAAAGIGRASGFYRAALEEGAGRFDTIDGLRGFLALGVFGEHAMSMRSLHVAGAWAADVPEFHLRASGAGVALFFMITAFLFWLRVLRKGEAFDLRAFLASRLRRLTPMYLFSVLLALLVVAAASGFALRVAPIELARELRPWLSFGFLPTGELNGVRDAHSVNAVYWTLAYEWLFYLALPLAALFAGGWRALLPVAALLYFGTVAPVVFCFLFGALAAAVYQRGWLRRLHSLWLAPLPLAALAGWFFAAALHPLLQYGLLFVFFVFVVHGYSVLGLLRSRAARLLGMASYSIYLLHCIVLYVVVGAVARSSGLADFGVLQYGLLSALAALAIVALSVLTYRYVEHPFLHPSAVDDQRRPSWIRPSISG